MASSKGWQDLIKQVLAPSDNLYFSDEDCTSTGYLLKSIQTEKAEKTLIKTGKATTQDMHLHTNVWYFKYAQDSS